MSEEMGVVIGIFLPLGFLTFAVLLTDIAQEWMVIKNFFRYRLWREGTVEILDWDFGKSVVTIKAGEDLHLMKGTFNGTFDLIYKTHRKIHIPMPWFLSPLSSLCVLVMRRVYYRQIDEAQQLIDL